MCSYLRRSNKSVKCWVGWMLTRCWFSLIVTKTRQHVGGWQIVEWENVERMFEWSEEFMWSHLMCTNKSGRLQSSDRRQALSCVNDNIVFSCLHVVEGMWFFHHILTQPGAQCSAEPCTSYSEIWSCIIPTGPIFCQGYLTDMKWVDAKQSKEGLT